MVEAGAGAIFLPLRPLVDTICLPIVGTHTEIVVHIATREGDGVLMGETHSANLLEPVNIATKVFCGPAGDFLFAELLCREHIQILHHDIGTCHHFIRGVESTVLGALLGVDENDTITTARTIYSRGGAVFQDIDRLDVVWINIGQISARNTVNNDKWSKTGISGRNTSDLDTGIIIRVCSTCILNGNAGYLTLYHH